MLVAIGITARAAERTFARDFDRERGTIAAQDFAPRGDKAFHPRDLTSRRGESELLAVKRDAAVDAVKREHAAAAANRPVEAAPIDASAHGHREIAGDVAVHRRCADLGAERLWQRQRDAAVDALHR